ncbi:MAG TPA: S41 family peptidase, partial [bacterium]|nr:S41 family peptidase [bacterium]
GMSIYKAIKLLKGNPDTTVTLTIARRSESELRRVTLTRAIIQTNAVAQSEKRMLDKRIGYIRLRDFTRDAADELENAIRDLEKQGMQGLILDLRDNVGGLLDVAVRICDLFIKKGQKIVSHRDRENYEKVYYAETNPVGDFQMAVLVNEFSASASEIVAGCIQDHKRGILVGPEGHRTFGKGSVQTLYELKEMPGMEGASLKLTTAKYFTPLGRSIEDEKGLAPDIYAQVNDDQRQDIRVAGKIGYLPPSLLGMPTVESATDTVQAPTPTTVAEVFSSEEDSGAPTESENLYDIELLTAYQCLKGIMLLQTGGGAR